ncbi:MAG: helix-turn-helix domain-containing protein [Methylotenera sp.]|nr:helix-turn-helix domain-containing protein [Methylotenera sp.]
MTIQSNKSINPIIANFAEMSDDSFIRPNDCAQLMRISIATFWRLVASGKLKTYKLTERTTTIRAGDLRAFINAQKGGL